jgi:hypothetical protein
MMNSITGYEQRGREMKQRAEGAKDEFRRMKDPRFILPASSFASALIALP